MSAGLPEEPTVSEVMQEEVAHQRIDPVPVTVEGPVRTQELPAALGTERNYDTTTTAQQLLGRDPKRKRVTLIGLTATHYVGKPDYIASGDAAQLPANVPVTITHQDEIWVATVAATGSISIFVETWTN